MYEKRFDGKGEIYARFRPSYPKEMIDFLYTEAGLSPNAAIADIGAGTGILTRLLLERGSTVFAVEPNADMRRQAETALKDCSACRFLCGNAEHTMLPDHCVDFVTAAQAFHWFDREQFKAECRRILKRSGKVILIWNCRDEASALVQENAEVNKQYCLRFRGFAGGLNSPEAQREALHTFFAGPFMTRQFENPQRFTQETFVGRNFSSSYAPSMDSDAGQRYQAVLQTLFQKYSQNGILTVPHHTYCHIGTV